MLKILHNVSCSKSNAAVNHLEKEQVNCNIRNIMEEPLSVEELKEVLKKLQIKAFDLVRTNESLYKEKFGNKDFQEEDWLKVLAENPSLIQRPILIKGNKAIIGRPLELVDAFLREE